MNWAVVVAKPAQKQVAKFPVKDQQRIAAAVRAMADDPFSGEIIKLEGAGDRWRRRVGNYRIFFAVDQAQEPAAPALASRLTRNADELQGIAGQGFGVDLHSVSHCSAKPASLLPSVFCLLYSDS